jgi:hypothetical protein
MVNLYVSLINKGLRELEQVPDVWKEDVERELNKKDEEATE